MKWLSLLVAMPLIGCSQQSQRDVIEVPVTLEIVSVGAVSYKDVAAERVDTYENQRYILEVDGQQVKVSDLVYVRLKDSILNSYPWMAERPNLRIFSHLEDEDVPSRTIWLTNRTALVIASPETRPGCFNTLVEYPRIDGGGFVKSSTFGSAPMRSFEPSAISGFWAL